MLRPFLAMSRFQLLSRVTCVSILLFLSGINTSLQIRAEDPKPINAVQGIVAAFKQHPVVIIGEVHWLRQPGEFYISLIRDREFQEAVQDIVVEFASRNNQPLLDKYITEFARGAFRLPDCHISDHALMIAPRSTTVLCWSGRLRGL